MTDDCQQTAPRTDALTFPRRSFVNSLAGLLAGHLLGCNGRRDIEYDAVDASIRAVLGNGITPGIAVCAVRGDEIEWSQAYGWADIASRKPMTTETIQNIASVSKTITATAVMQLWEAKRIALDDDVDAHLPFPVRNPRFPDVAVTIRQLLTHTSSITDGPAYEPSYACGDPSISLMDWLQAYFDPTGSNYHPAENFLSWKPGTLDPPTGPRAYSNLAFGLLGGLVEIIARQSFAEYCRHNIFEPLGMKHTGWYLRSIEAARHAIPYGTSVDPRLPSSSSGSTQVRDDPYFEHCLYSFPNYPDGLLRTSVTDLSRFLRAYMGNGESLSVRILDDFTVDTMLTESHNGQGLCWRKFESLHTDSTIWGHTGSDPGVRTSMAFSRNGKTGAIVFSNYDGWTLVPNVAELMLATAAKHT